MKKILKFSSITLLLVLVLVASYFLVQNYLFYQSAKKFFSNKSYLNIAPTDYKPSKGSNGELIKTAYGLNFYSPWKNTQETINAGSFVRYSSGLNYINVSALTIKNQETKDASVYLAYFKKIKPDFVSEIDLNKTLNQNNLSEPDLYRAALNSVVQDIKFPAKKDKVIFAMSLLTLKDNIFEHKQATVQHFIVNGLEGYKVDHQDGLSDVYILTKDQVFNLKIKGKSQDVDFIIYGLKGSN